MVFYFRWGYGPWKLFLSDGLLEVAFDPWQFKRNLFFCSHGLRTVFVNDVFQAAMKRLGGVFVIMALCGLRVNNGKLCICNYDLIIYKKS